MDKKKSEQNKHLKIRARRRVSRTSTKSRGREQKEESGVEMIQKGESRK
jgi:hypothetical protein